MGVGISFGTATFAVCVKNNKMYGAIIAPSIETGIKNLHSKTALVRCKSITKLSANFGVDTETALQAGAFHMVNGFINSALMYANKKYHINHAYATGGKLKAIKVSCGENIHFVDHAVIWGYFYLTKVLS
jgi:pantothenate kinase type III